MKRAAPARSTSVPPPGLRIKLEFGEALFLKDPISSELGQEIVEQGILLLDEIGYELFTFRKLAVRIGATEASIYRYFKSKHLLLLYLTSWYWHWMEYRVQFATRNVDSAHERLRLALHELTQSITNDYTTPRIDEAALYRVVVAESSKTYLQRSVDAENREGLFRSYKRLCRGVADLIIEINPRYQYPVALISTVVETSHMQKYFAEHLPSLTEVQVASAGRSTTAFLTKLVFSAIAADPSASPSHE